MSVIADLYFAREYSTRFVGTGSASNFRFAFAIASTFNTTDIDDRSANTSMHAILHTVALGFAAGIYSDADQMRAFTLSRLARPAPLQPWL